MALITKVTYDDKININPIVTRVNQATAEDFIELKEVINNCVDGINWIKSDEADIPAGTTRILFNSAYPSGVPFAILIHNCYESNGYLAAHSITNKDIDGFDVTVSVPAKVLYLTSPKR